MPWKCQRCYSTAVRTTRSSCARCAVPKGRWYKDVAAGGSVRLEVAGRQLAVQAIPVSDPAAVARASQEYLRKYQPSPYAQAMVRSDVLPTTLRLEPR